MLRLPCPSQYKAEVSFAVALSLPASSFMTNPRSPNFLIASETVLLACLVAVTIAACMHLGCCLMKFRQSRWNGPNEASTTSPASTKPGLFHLYRISRCSMSLPVTNRSTSCVPGACCKISAVSTVAAMPWLPRICSSGEASLSVRLRL